MRIIIPFILILLFSCGERSNFVPKPKTYLRVNLPKHEYKVFQKNCPYTFEAPKFFTVSDVKKGSTMSCHKDIDLGPLDGIIHFSYIDMVEPLSKYVNFANDKVDEHKLKATSIQDKQYIFKNKRVFGTFFQLKGNVASPFQFYLTDSTDRFVSGVVYFNSPPNYDSLKPTLDYLEIDLEHFIETFEWKN